MKKLNIFLLFCLFCVSGCSIAGMRSRLVSPGPVLTKLPTDVVSDLKENEKSVVDQKIKDFIDQFEDFFASNNITAVTYDVKSKKFKVDLIKDNLKTSYYQSRELCKSEAKYGTCAILSSGDFKGWFFPVATGFRPKKVII